MGRKWIILLLMTLGTVYCTGCGSGADSVSGIGRGDCNIGSQPSEFANSTAYFVAAGSPESRINLQAFGPAPYTLINMPTSVSLSGNNLTMNHDAPVHELALVCDADGRYFEFWNTTAPTESPQFPLSVSSDKRWVVDNSGEPFNVNGDTAWSIMVQLDQSEVTTYLADRAAKEVNLILINLIEHKFSDQVPAWKNATGDLPFSESLIFGTPDFTEPQEEYWRNVDWVLREAYRFGITVLALPAYLGYDHGDEGWASIMESSGVNAMTDYGAFIGERYRDYPNIIWAMGGDAPPAPAASPLDLTAEINSLANAIKSIDSNHLMTAHSAPGRSSMDDYNQPWLDLNATYTQAYIVPAMRTSYEMLPPIPTFLFESTYGNEHGNTDQSLRIQMWQAVLGGGFGHIYGNAPTWYFNAAIGDAGFANVQGLDWRTQLNQLGAQYLEHVARVQQVRDISMLAPDYSHQIVISGYDPNGDQGPGYVPVAASDRILLAYMPSQGHVVTVDRTRFAAGSYNVTWFNVGTGDSTDGGTTSMGMGMGTEMFSPPDSGDWLLMIDDAALGLPLP